MQTKSKLFRDLTETEEDNFRQWAHDNWKLGDNVNELWHPVIREEIALIQAGTKRVIFSPTAGYWANGYFTQDRSKAVTYDRTGPINLTHRGVTDARWEVL